MYICVYKTQKEGSSPEGGGLVDGEVGVVARLHPIHCLLPPATRSLPKFS